MGEALCVKGRVGGKGEGLRVWVRAALRFKPCVGTK